MQENKGLSVKEYRKLAFRKRQIYIIICSIFEMLCTIVICLCFYGDIDKKFLLPAVVIFSLFFSGKISCLIAYFIDVNNFKQLNPDLED